MVLPKTAHAKAARAKPNAPPRNAPAATVPVTAASRPKRSVRPNPLPVVKKGAVNPDTGDAAVVDELLPSGGSLFRTACFLYPCNCRIAAESNAARNCRMSRFDRGWAYDYASVKSALWAGFLMSFPAEAEYNNEGSEMMSVSDIDF
jgi:hypothetical protein